ncbi:LysR family transcriptional regulator [Azospirillum sp.]|uniref:LysR family transcriptional regulator n=1 Tax=Azospirillum sp. TaxID=34012 RepID=UPI003D725E00
MSGIELRHLRCFVTLADIGNFGRAAKRLGMSQPAVSQLLKRLEDLLGQRLFDRTRSAVALTPAGALFLPQARRALAAVEEAMEEARRGFAGEVGRLRLGLSVPSLYNQVPALIRAFRARRPEVEVVIDSVPSGEQEGALLERRIDVGFSNFSTADPRLVQRLIGAEPMRVVLPRWHALAGAAAVPIGRLREERWILPPRAMAPEHVDEVDALCRAQGFTPRLAAECPNFPTVVGMVLADVGIALAPESFAGLAGPELVQVPIDGSAPLIRCYLTYRRDDETPVVRRFLELAETSA